jgi:hypothetical protein
MIGVFERNPESILLALPELDCSRVYLNRFDFEACPLDGEVHARDGV